jgi:class 3 adenylate cyclase/predicted ATPase
MKVADWLKCLGLEQYEPAFRAHDVDALLLPNLTSADLNELGIGVVGHRRKLLDAIAALRDDAAQLKAPRGGEEPGGAAAVESGAERRQLTVMVADLVGSTALSSRMDPEDLRELIAAYQQCVARIVRRADGFIARYMGDGALIYFGYPRAHEDDAERAVRAGLDLVAAVRTLGLSVSLQVRVGIATGLVVVGDVVGSGAALEHMVVGETPNLAARLQSMAEPDTVVIEESTRRLIGNLFEYRDLGCHDLKGAAAPVQAWMAVRARAVESRFDALRATALTPLIGREQELDLLVGRWQRAKGGAGQVVLLAGEPGIGKSRLAAGLLERVADEPHTRLRYFCSPRRADSALYPISGQLERAAGFALDDDAARKLDKLDALFAHIATRPRDAALLAELLSLPGDGRYPTLDLTPQQRRQETLQALTAQIGALARRQPVLAIFEDAHWIDPTSLELLDRTVALIRRLPVLLIITFRPEFKPPWIGRQHVTILTINRLADADVAVVIETIAGKRTLPSGVAGEIVERTDGIPLFVEEMTKAMLESSSIEAWDIASAAPASTLSVPATLHASLLARLDRGGSAKQVAQIGAAIGRQFSYELMAAVAGHDDQELRAALKRITDLGIVSCHGTPPQARYLFKHVLVQDAAYGTLLRKRRRALHARIAQALTRRSPDAAELHPEILAHHYTEAGLLEQAASFWGKAGQKSIAQSALVEAIAQLTKALNLIAEMPPTRALRREQIKLQAALAGTLIHVKGYSSPQVIAAFERAREMIERADALGEGPEDPLLRFSVLYGLWVPSNVAFDGDTALNRARQFLALAEELGQVAPLIVGHRLMGTSLVMRGELEAGRAHLDRALALYVPELHRPLSLRFGQDIGVAAWAYRALAHWLLGQPDAALSDAAAGLATGRALGQAASLMYALFAAAMVENPAGKLAAAEAHAQELIALAGDKGAPMWRAFGFMAWGWTLSLTGRAVEAIDKITSGLEAYAATGATVFRPNYVVALARAHAACGEFDEARRALAEALAATQSSKERWSEPEIHRTAGELALARNGANQEEAEDHFQRSLSVARTQNARSYELRAATSIARLWREQDRRAEGRDLLAPVYAAFTQGFETPDLIEAKSLLDQLA